jgi:hypothetical protein
MSKKVLEPGYEGVLLWGETKARLRQVVRNSPDTRLFLERRLVTAALEWVMSDPLLTKEWFSRVPDIARREIATAEAMVAPSIGGVKHVIKTQTSLMKQDLKRLMKCEPPSKE